MDPADIDRIGATFRHPVEDIEPREDDDRESYLRVLQILSGAISWIHAAKNKEVGIWQVTYALGLPQATVPMTTVAAALGVERATISSGARKFLKAFDLPPSFAMRSEKAVRSYRECRISKLKK